MTDFVIDAEFKNIIPPLAPDEYEGLKRLIQDAGRARDTLKVWNGILLDGHNRYGICLELGLPYSTEEITGICSINETILWIIRNQHGRRNLALVDRAILAAKEQDILKEEVADKKSEDARLAASS